MDDDVAVVVDGLVKHFPVRAGLVRAHAQVRAVDGVGFRIRRGQTFGLVGESGCGKTSVALLLVKLLEPTAGRIGFEGTDIADLRGAALREFRRRVQIVFQDTQGAFDPRQTMLDAMTEPLHALGIATSRARAVHRAVESTRLVGLDVEVLARRPHELSGGQRQRVLIARALAIGPRFVVLDEPTSSVDVSVQAQILGLLGELRRTHALTYLLISHNLVVVRSMSDVVAVMYLGTIVEMADAAELFARPRHPYSVALISAIPVPDPDAPRHPVLARGDIPSAVRLPSGCRYHPRCPYAERVCREEEPPLADVSSGHHVACHFPGVADGPGPSPR